MAESTQDDSTSRITNLLNEVKEELNNLSEERKKQFRDVMNVFNNTKEELKKEEKIELKNKITENLDISQKRSQILDNWKNILSDIDSSIESNEKEELRIVKELRFVEKGLDSESPRSRAYKEVKLKRGSSSKSPNGRLIQVVQLKKTNSEKYTPKQLDHIIFQQDDRCITKDSCSYIRRKSTGQLVEIKEPLSERLPKVVEEEPPRALTNEKSIITEPVRPSTDDLYEEEIIRSKTFEDLPDICEPSSEECTVNEENMNKSLREWCGNTVNEITEIFSQPMSNDFKWCETDIITSQFIYLMFITEINDYIGFYIPTKCIKLWKWEKLQGLRIFAIHYAKSCNKLYYCKSKKLPLSVCFYNNYGSVFSLGNPSKCITVNKEDIVSDFSNFNSFFEHPKGLQLNNLKFKTTKIYLC